MARRPHQTRLPAPFLKRVSLRAELVPEDRPYPFDLPWLAGDWALEFDQPVTILVGENGTGKSTLVEALAALSGYDEAGGGKGYRPVDHAGAVDRSGAGLADALRAAWLPKVTRGWFFKAESFFSVARYLDVAARDAGEVPPDFLSWSHGEGFARVFEERMSEQGLYFLDEPESALSPRRQLELLRILSRIQSGAGAQVIMATHSPLLMAVPGAQLLRLHWRGIEAIRLQETSHFRIYRDFVADPEGFVQTALREDAE